MAAATLDIAKGGTTKLAGLSERLFKIISQEVDFSVAANALANGESITLINIPAKTLVLQVAVKITKAATAGGDKFDIGDDASHNFYVAVGDDAAGWLMGDGSTGAVTVITAAASKLYTAANDIRLTAHTGTMVGAKLTVIAVCLDLSEE